MSQDEFKRLAVEQLDTLYRFAHRLTRNPVSAEDLVQETFLRALRAWESFDLKDFGIRPWLLRIMYNLHLSRSEREKRQPTAMQDEHLEAAGGQRDAGHLPLTPGSFEGMDDRLVRALEQLRPEYQSVMLLWAVEELSYKEIADVVGVPIGTVMSRLHRARQRLSEQLQDFAIKEGIIRE